MPPADADAIRRALCERIDPRRVRWDDPVLEAHARDTWPLALLRQARGKPPVRPACVVAPGSVEEVAAILQWADTERIPIVPFGAGSGVCGGIQPRPDAVVVDLREMNRLLHVDETALIAEVEAGMMGDQYEAALNDRGYSMRHFPQSIALSTVGGWVATRAAGQFSTRYGNIEDRLAGLEAVVPGGRVMQIKPVPRRSAGPDLRHLFLGSEGTLGIVTRLWFRIFPLPEERKLLSYSFPDFDSGLEAVRALLREGWHPPVLRLYDAAETARHFGEWASAESCFLIAISEGPVSLVAAEAAACHNHCSARGGEAVGEAPAAHWLRERNHVPDLAELVARGFVVDTIEVAADWNRIGRIYHRVIADVSSVPGILFVSGHSSHSYPDGTNIYFTFVAHPDKDTDPEETYRECWRRTMEATLAQGGTISHHHGIGRLRAPWMRAEHGEALALLRAVKRVFDPNGIMNPGVLFPPDE